MSTPHLSAPEHADPDHGGFAPVVLLPGSPDRADRLASMLTDAHVVSDVRGYRGWTGYHPRSGVPVSVQPTGMGIPSLLIYAHELVTVYGAHTLLRVGTCGTSQPSLALGDIVVVRRAYTNNASVGAGAQLAHPDVVRSLLDHRDVAGSPVHLGTAWSTDVFYPLGGPDDSPWIQDADAIDMESAGLFRLADVHGVRAGAVCTVADHLDRHEHWHARERDLAVDAMLRLAVAAAGALA